MSLCEQHSYAEWVRGALIIYRGTTFSYAYHKFSGEFRPHTSQQDSNSICGEYHNVYYEVLMRVLVQAYYNYSKFNLL